MHHEENVEMRTLYDFLMVARRRVMLVSVQDYITVGRYCADTGSNELPRLASPLGTRHAYPQHKHGVKTPILLLPYDERTVHRFRPTAPTKQMYIATRTAARDDDL